MMLILALKLVELARARHVGGQQFTHAHEGTHDLGEVPSNRRQSTISDATVTEVSGHRINL